MARASLQDLIPIPPKTQGCVDPRCARLDSTPGLGQEGRPSRAPGKGHCTKLERACQHHHKGRQPRKSQPRKSLSPSRPPPPGTTLSPSRLPPPGTALSLSRSGLRNSTVPISATPDSQGGASEQHRPHLSRPPEQHRPYLGRGPGTALSPFQPSPNSQGGERKALLAVRSAEKKTVPFSTRRDVSRWSRQAESRSQLIGTMGQAEGSSPSPERAAAPGIAQGAGVEHPRDAGTLGMVPINL